MDVKEFEYLVALADHKSVTRAANQLFITQACLLAAACNGAGTFINREFYSSPQTSLDGEIGQLDQYPI